MKRILMFMLLSTILIFCEKVRANNHTGTILATSESNVAQQQKRVYGTVTDLEGGALPFVTVLVKGTNIGTITDENGIYELNVSGNVTLIFSYMGFRDYEISTEGKTQIDVVLLENDVRLDEVVVTGYNSIERKHLASSIESVDMGKNISRPIIKLQDVFSGTVPGVTMLKGSNLPGSVPGSISIRGISTLQNAEPLVIIDGMEQPLTDVDPNQIKSISILKDAAAASMYGSRGANGVIVVETHRGNASQFSVNVNSWFAVYQPLHLPDFVNSADFMRLRNEALSLQSQPLLYTEDDISKAEQGLTPNTDWIKEIMERTSTSHNTSVSISGGGGVGTFNLMLNYIKENGLNKIEGSDKFSVRFNTNINIADRFILLADFYAHRLKVDRLRRNNDGHGLYQIAWRMNPTQAVFYNDTIPEHYMLHNDLNPVAFINRGGTWNYMYDKSTINLRPRYYITDYLNFEGNVSYMIDKSASKWKRLTYKFYDGDGKPVTTWGNDIGSQQNVSQSQLTGRGLLNFEKNIRNDKDKIYAVAGAEAMSYVFTDYREITKASFFTKVNYSFDDRYLLEATFRSDGSSKFAPGRQWGIFPSASFGWNIHNEKFISSLKNSGAITNMKLRVSWGKIGNENVNPYLWQEIVNTWGWTMRVPNPDFTWEKQKQWNFGLDLSLWQNRLSLTADVYKKHSYDLIYSDFPVPPLTGSYYLTSSVNIGEVENKGWEVSAKWSDNIGDFSYSIGGMIFNNKNQVLKAGYNASDTLIFKGTNDKIWYKGIPIDNYYGYKTNGYFQNKAEIEATNAKFPNTLPGDIKYVDQNGDGILNDADRVFLGDPAPHYNYSISLDMRYKQWDFSMLGQGVGKRVGRLGGQEGYPVYVDGGSNNLGAPRQYYADNRWTPETPNSRFPRVWTGTSTNTYLSDVWLSDASFFRIKTMQLGYSIPKLGKHFRNMRIYLNAEDFLTFTKWEGLEPERDGGNGAYPRMASYSIGIQVTLF
ncbi:SusC/RagA family TonB-linked outer membrane protein [Phocaeicola abscessus]|uniref:SusC/RagA family TonB-linked outer membrane protein n=1 Tax=Phocaeicola abscessus TaxID=555313 RepID=UPI0028F16288|nr:SusC/RagA family TonB-linked outer membrane protein [Phocaeicola abscessus]